MTETPGLMVGYARVSTAEQKLDLQIDALAKEGVRPENMFSDKASGGAGVKRVGFEAMWKTLRAGDTLVVWKLDRLGRSMTELLATVARIQRLGAKLVVVTEKIDTTTITGKFVFHILAAMAEMERDLIIERTIAGQAAGRARGKKPGRRNVLTTEKKDEAIRLLRTGMGVRDVATKIEVGKSVLYTAVNGELAPRLVEQHDEPA